MLVDGDKIKSIDRLLNRLQDQLDAAELEEIKMKKLKKELEAQTKGKYREQIQFVGKNGNIVVEGREFNINDLLKMGNPNKDKGSSLLNSMTPFRANIVGNVDGESKLFVEKK